MSLAKSIPANEITKYELQSLFEWAGMKLLSLPISGTRPNSYKNNWPSFANDINTNLTHFSGLKIRPTPPNGHEIDLLDKIFDLVIHLDNINQRRIIHARSLINPVSLKHIYHWIQIAQMIDSDRRSVRRYYDYGLDQIINNSDNAYMIYLKSQIK